MSEKTEVDLTGAKQNHGVWLVKVSQQCANASGKGELIHGSVVYHQVSFTLNEDLTSLSAFGEKAASVRAPRDHPMTMHSVGGKTMAVFTESSAGNSQLSCSNTVTPKTNSFFGRLSFQFSAANDWNELQKSLKLETLISLTSFKHQLSEQLTDYSLTTTSFPTYEKRKKAEGRMVRAYRQQVMDMLFSAFEEHQYYNIKDLVEVAKQPTYLKEILREMGVYNAKGTHKSTWELKPEYHHYQGSGEMKRDEPRKEHPVWDINAPSILFFDWYPKSHDQSVCLLSTCW
uniref:General transcription factor IIF subunit 2 n=1 Tax=Oncorhynchus mykiss TaxID=8022 RepID=A0A8C7SSR8_ONCMY